MILIGQYDSPFVRRVGDCVAAVWSAVRAPPWSTFGDADKIAPYNPLRRVPTLVLDNGEALIESTMHPGLSRRMRRSGQSDDRADGERAAAAKICALASGLGDKARQPASTSGCCVRKSSQLWVERCEAQIAGVLDVLEKERAAVTTP